MSDRITRRRYISSGATGVVAAGLAGCVGDGNGNSTPTPTGSSGGGDTATPTQSAIQGVDEVVIGTSAPLSGPFSPVGNRATNAIELAGEHAQEAGEIGSFTYLTADNGSDPAKARQIAQEQINKGIDFSVTGLNEAVSVAVGRLMNQNGIVDLASSSSQTLDFEECLEYFFKIGMSMPHHLEPLRYLEDQGEAESVFTIYSDFQWPQLLNQHQENFFFPNSSLENAGSVAVPLGTSDFSSAISKAEESGADTIHYIFFGAPLFGVLGQSKEFGFLDQDKNIAVPAAELTLAQALDNEILRYDNAYFNMYGSYHKLDNENMRNITQQYREEYDKYPAFEILQYVGTRTLLRASAEVGTTDAEKVREQLRGHEFVPNIYPGDSNRFRACDQRVYRPSILMQGTPASDFSEEEQNWFEVVNVRTDINSYAYPCSDMACK
jgi:ABC-type branched-subunit amino acid transport system substrate-binding protein